MAVGKPIAPMLLKGSLGAVRIDLESDWNRRLNSRCSWGWAEIRLERISKTKRITGTNPFLFVQEQNRKAWLVLHSRVDEYACLHVGTRLRRVN